MSAERTEKATPKRRDQARQEGQAARSQEVGNLFVLTAGFATVSLLAPKLLHTLEQTMATSFRGLASHDLAHGGLTPAFSALLAALLALCAPVFAATAVSGTVASVLQVRPKLILKPIKPDLKRLNPIQGVKRFFSPHSLAELIKNVLKLTVIGAMAFLTIYPRRYDLIAVGQLSPVQAVGVVGSLVTSLVWRTLGVLLLIAAADVMWSRHTFEKGLKMSKEDVKQEAKQQDLPPEVKGKLRQKQRQLARARMLQDVQHADVVVTNPTHYAVALVYRPDDGAPRVVAKGADLLALRIRELAREHHVSIVENPPLARHLYAEVEIGQHIPAAAFAAVAEVLAYVFKTNRRKSYAWA
jgi:flagellar biosynthetic protein FlhB